MSGDTFDLSGRVALVTGASRGIGRSIALLLARHGAILAVTSRRVEACEAVAAEIRNAGGQAFALACHIGEPEQISATLREIDARCGRLDILVNNAATNPYYGPAVDMDLAAYQKTVEVNIRGYFWTSIEAARRMLAQGKGAIVNVASEAALLGYSGCAAYCASKGALIGLTRALAVEWAPHNVTVNALVPGLFRTDLNAALLDSPRGQEFLMRTPMKRFGKIDELVGAAVFLSSEAASFVTGHMLAVDGGFLSSGVNQ